MSFGWFSWLQAATAAPIAVEAMIGYAKHSAAGPAACGWAHLDFLGISGLWANVTGVICFLPFPSRQTPVGSITSASVLMYAGAPPAYGVFADRLPHRERPHRLPGGKIVSPLSFVEHRRGRGDGRARAPTASAP